MFFLISDFLSFFSRYNITICFNFQLLHNLLFLFANRLYFNIFHLFFFFNKFNILAGVSNFYLNTSKFALQISNLLLTNTVSKYVYSTFFLKKALIMLLKKNEFLI